MHLRIRLLWFLFSQLKPKKLNWKSNVCVCFRIRVQAVNAVGAGPFSSVLKTATLPLPPAPPVLECATQGHNFLKLKWGDGRNPNFTNYTVEMEKTKSNE